MATKKQRRAAAEAKHEAMMAEYRRSGLEAQRKDRERRAAQARRIEEEKQRAARKKSTLRALSDMKREHQIAEDMAHDITYDAVLDDEQLAREQSIDLTRKDETA